MYEKLDKHGEALIMGQPVRWGEPNAGINIIDLPNINRGDQ
jgi:hypothetical protein